MKFSFVENKLNSGWYNLKLNKIYSTCFPMYRLDKKHLEDLLKTIEVQTRYLIDDKIQNSIGNGYKNYIERFYSAEDMDFGKTYIDLNYYQFLLKAHKFVKNYIRNKIK